LPLHNRGLWTKLLSDYEKMLRKLRLFYSDKIQEKGKLRSRVERDPRFIATLIHSSA
jgi:hypothetical protein